MSRFEKLVLKILSGKADQNLSIKDLKNLLINLGFEEKQASGSHTLYKKAGLPEIINIQSTKNGQAKAYQVRQIREIILKYKLV
jgi:predicted RNA binding protein YcfA (HicA-like mRNA interferase family)